MSKNPCPYCGSEIVGLLNVSGNNDTMVFYKDKQNHINVFADVHVCLDCGKIFLNDEDRKRIRGRIDA